MASFVCQKEMIPHVKQVLAGEYGIAYKHDKPIILDIGANVGAFAIWAIQKWPKANIYCYEPNPENFVFLSHNTSPYLNQIHLYKKAVGNIENTKLYLGKHNSGESSFYNLGEQTDDFVEVITIPPSELPKANILKMDTEGSEIDILCALDVQEYDVVALEFHSERDRRIIDTMLSDFTVTHGFIRTANRGVLTYINNRIL